MKCKIVAHHNVEDFRPYTINFKDKGSKSANEANAVKLAVKREGEWNGWFEPDGILEGTSLKDVNKKIDEMFATNAPHLIISGFERDEEDEVIPSVHVALVIWNEDEGQNIGFGEAWAEGRLPTINDADKYTNKWVELVG